MSAHPLTPTTLYCCYLCGFSTPSPAQRLAHLRREHGEEVAPPTATLDDAALLWAALTVAGQRREAGKQS